MYADFVTPSMEYAIRETERRRAIQEKYNEEHGIVPQTIVKKVSEILEISTKAEEAGGKSKKKKKYTAAEKRDHLMAHGAHFQRLDVLVDAHGVDGRGKAQIGLGVARHERGGVRVHFARFDLGEVQRVVDDVEQGVGQVQNRALMVARQRVVFQVG